MRLITHISLIVCFFLGYFLAYAMYYDTALSILIDERENMCLI
jgi:hypothetical protein